MRLTTPLIFLIVISLASSDHHQPAAAVIGGDDPSFVSFLIASRGLDFIINRAISSLTHLRIPQIESVHKIPLLGSVTVRLSNLTIHQISVSEPSVNAGDSSFTVVVSGARANLSLYWYYSYFSGWFKISDSGYASVKLNLSLRLENEEGTLKLSLLVCGCFIKDLAIKLDGGASWLYQGLVDVFVGEIESAVEKAITENLKEGAPKIDSFLESLPKGIPIDDIASLNVTFVNDPTLSNSSIGFEINVLLTPNYQKWEPKLYKEQLQTFSYDDPSKMIGMSIDEAVFRSASTLYFEEIQASGLVKLIGNNLGGKVKLGDLKMTLKWSKIGDLKLFLVQPVLWTVVETVLVPYANIRLWRGFPLPMVRGFTLENAKISCLDSRLIICSDVAYTPSNNLHEALILSS